MRLTTVNTCFLAALCLLGNAVAQAQHLGDIELAVEGDRLVTENHGGDDRIFVNEFDDLGGVLFTDDPGFEADTGALPADAEISFHVVQHLWYWDGDQPHAPASASLSISGATSHRVDVTGASGAQAGFHIATASSSGTIHAHLEYTLAPFDVSTGVYGVILEVTSPGLQSSEPFLIAFNHGLDELDRIDAGVDAIAESAGILAAPGVEGDTDGDGDVDLDDLNRVRNYFGASGQHVDGDTFPFDGVVNLDDLNRVRNQFGATAGAATVPEPAAWSVMFGLLVGASIRFRQLLR